MKQTVAPRYEAESLDELFFLVLDDLAYHPQHVAKPRDMRVKECLAATLVLEDPRNRLLTCESRAANYGFAVGEFLWYLNGRRDLQTMLYYNRRMDQFSDDGKTLNSAYGYRLRNRPFYASVDNPGPGLPQWETAIRTLSADSDSRRAVLLINLPEDERLADYAGSKDVPCTLSLQFFVRDGKLDLHVHMRSNDVIWGLPYDVFSFTLLQECMMLELIAKGMTGLTLGRYYHTVGSIHLYERHFEMAEKIVKETSSSKEPFASPMLALPGLKELGTLSKDEELLRKGEIAAIQSTTYGGCLAWMAERLNEHRIKRDAEGLKP